MVGSGVPASYKVAMSCRSFWVITLYFRIEIS
nr:MAG TPA: hypothetical protein [Caudoviricetes sp.]